MAEYHCVWFMVHQEFLRQTNTAPANLSRWKIQWFHLENQRKTSNLCVWSLDWMVIILSVPAAGSNPGQQPAAPLGPAPHNDSNQNRIHAEPGLKPIRDPTPLVTDWPNPHGRSARACLLYQLCQQHKEQHWKKLTCSQKTAGGLREVLRAGPFRVGGELKPPVEVVKPSQ